MSCIRRRADRVRSRHPLIRRRPSAAAEQARDDTNDIPQQRVVSRMMNVGLDHCGVDTQLLAVLQFEGDRRLHHQIIDCLERLGREPGEAAVECIVSRHRQTIEIRELAQCASIGNPLAQFAIVPVLDAHENQRAQDLLRRQATATSLGFLQTPRQIAADLLDHLLLVVKKVGNGWQQRLRAQALTHQLPIGKTDLSLHYPRHRSALVDLHRSGALALQRLDISRCHLVQQILQRAPIVQTALNLWHKLFRHVDGNTTPVRPTVKDITLMLLARQTSPAVFADAPAPPQSQRTKNRRPEISRFTLQPARDIRGRFRINMLHVEHVMLYTYPDKAKSHGKIVRNPLISALKRISRQKLARSAFPWFESYQAASASL